MSIHHDSPTTAGPSRQRRPRVRATMAVLAMAIAGAAIAPVSAGAAPPPPTYRVEAIGFKVIDETNPETCWPFECHDEVYWVYNSVGIAGQVNKNASSTYHNLDDGNVRDMRPYGNDRCVFGSRCEGRVAGPAGIGVSISLFEQDHSVKRNVIDSVGKGLATAGDLFGKVPYLQWVGTVLNALGKVLSFVDPADDHIASQTYAYTPQTLARLTKPGASFTETRPFNPTGDGNYELTLKVTRVS